MSVKVAINGFGRIGRLAFRQMFGAEVKVTPGSYDNIKLTTPGDMLFAAEILKNREK